MFTFPWITATNKRSFCQLFPFGVFLTKQIHLVKISASLFDELLDAVFNLAYLLTDCFEFDWLIFVEIIS